MSEEPSQSFESLPPRWPGHDGEALEELISEFMAPGSEDQPPDCQYPINKITHKS